MYFDSNGLYPSTSVGNTLCKSSGVLSGIVGVNGCLCNGLFSLLNSRSFPLRSSIRCCISSSSVSDIYIISIKILRLIYYLPMLSSVAFTVFLCGTATTTVTILACFTTFSTAWYWNRCVNHCGRFKYVWYFCVHTCGKC
jgi:hypothetical protein